MKWTEDKILKKDLAWLHANDDVEMEIDSQGDVITTAKDSQGSLPNLPVIDKSQPSQGDSPPLLPKGASQDPTDGMDIDMGSGGGSGEPENTATAARGMGGDNPQSKETPISPYPTLEYGLPNTHTTILPWRSYVSFGFLDHATPLRLQLRMNSVWDMLITDIVGLANGATIGAKAWYNLPVAPGGANINGATFPAAPVTGAAQVAERPQWRDYWGDLYSHYTVLGCKWRATVMATGNTRGADVEVAQHYDSWTDNSTATGNVVPAAPYIEMKTFKNVKWHVIECDTAESNSDTNVKIISGTYKPGTISHNIRNDGDVKTWTTTSLAGGATAPIPALKDVLTLDFYRSGMSYAIPAATCGNVCIELDYIVQFKDLIQQGRWPNSVTAGQDIVRAITQTAGTDDVRIKQ